MENNKAKVKYIGEIFVVLGLEIIMLLFRMVQPIAWPTQMPLTWQNFCNELVYAGVELGLIIVIVAHFIFKISFKELGLTRLKDNIGSLIGNLCFLGLCIGVSFFVGQFSKLVEFNSLNIGLQVIANFTMIAFVRELVFRGFLFRAIVKLLNGKGILASIISGALFAVTYIPNILMSLNEVHTSALLSVLTIPLLLGIYLGLIYYYGCNLWVCVIIQGVCLSIVSLESDIFINILGGAYSLGLLIYLIYKMINYYKHKDESEEKEHLNEEESISRQEVVLESTHTKEIDLPQFMNLEHRLDEESKIDLQEELEKRMILPNLKNQLEKQIEEVMKRQEQNMDEEEDLGKVAAIPNTEEELGKVVNLQVRKQEEQQNPKKLEDLDNTIVMPCITEAEAKESSARVQPKDVDLLVEAEPNFIAHLEKYLGDFEGIYKQTVPTEMPIDILCFTGEKYNAIVTNGMRAMTMLVPPELKDYQQIELMMFVDKSFDLSGEGLQREESAWLIKLLTDLALYPNQTSGYLAWGHIVGNSENLEAYDASVAYCGALIYPPLLQEDMTFYRYMEKGRNIFIYNVMPLFREELKFIQEHSSDQFVNLMSGMGVDQVVKTKRLNVIENMNRLL